jgi:hypothetical protein
MKFSGASVFFKKFNMFEKFELQKPQLPILYDITSANPDACPYTAGSCTYTRFSVNLLTHASSTIYLSKLNSKTRTYIFSCL